MAFIGATRRCSGGAWMDGVANLGYRPVVGGTDFLLEVYLFNFDYDLYGCRMETRFVEKIRDEADFSGLDELVAQMRRDEAKAVLENRAIRT